MKKRNLLKGVNDDNFIKQIKKNNKFVVKFLNKNFNLNIRLIKIRKEK